MYLSFHSVYKRKHCSYVIMQSLSRWHHFTDDTVKTIIIHDWTTVTQREDIVAKFKTSMLNNERKNNIAKEAMLLALNVRPLAKLKKMLQTRHWLSITGQIQLADATRSHYYHKWPAIVSSALLVSTRNNHPQYYNSIQFRTFQQLWESMMLRCIDNLRACSTADRNVACVGTLVSSW